MTELPRRNKITEKYDDLYCEISPRLDFLNITIIDPSANITDHLLSILNRYKNATVVIKNISTLKELNNLCSFFGEYSYSGSVEINLTSRINNCGSLKGLSNNKYINLEALPNNVKISGFSFNGTQSDFTSWAHNLNNTDKNTLLNCLTTENKQLFLEEERIIKSFYSELIKVYPEIMTYDEKKRFEILFMYVNCYYKYDSESLDESSYVRLGCDYAHSAIETFKRGKGVCDGRSNLLTMVTNNSLLRCNSSSIDGYTDKTGGLPHTWNVFIDQDGSAYYYDLSFRNYTRREIHDIGERRITKIHHSKVQEIFDRKELPPRRNNSPKVRVLKPLPPRREEQ